MHLDLSTRSQVIGFTALGEVVTTTTDDPTSEKSTRLSGSQIVRTLKKTTAGMVLALRKFQVLGSSYLSRRKIPAPCKVHSL